MRPALPAAFLRAPIAHRALHDAADQRPENSRAAVRAALSAGYGVELDLQLSADGQAVVFHDTTLDRMTGEPGLVRDRSRAELAAIPLAGGAGEGIPSLAEVLALVAGQVPLLLELKDQDGSMGPGGVGALEAAVADALRGYEGPVALMSFNPHAVAEMARVAPEVPRGLVTSSYEPQDWPDLPKAVCDDLRGIHDFERVDAGFISHQADDLARRRVQQLRDQGVPVLCWTVKSLAEDTAARAFADNVTFEGYLPPAAP
ncbi:glycerophosphodiester phosphodiesterase family protein [Cribrihabitans neustonicus]|uniref:glycerophosphodiester phosphodiesterase family protein n=1 Tax=Cribrihabitans neustonicus TaxID=1429085 RepID=UPI003B5B8AB5